MIRKIKNVLGIEGVKVAIDMPVEAEVQDRINTADPLTLDGHLVFTTPVSQTVTAVTVRFIETYRRGRGKNKRIDDYLLGEWHYDEPLLIEGESEYRLPFALAYEMLPSAMERFQARNLVFRGIGSIAKLAKNARSTYTVAAEVKVKGTAFNPRAEKQIYLL